MSASTFPDKSVLGEVAFQLERRILDYVFANSLPEEACDHSAAARRRRFYGYTVNNIGEMINREVCHYWPVPNKPYGFCGLHYWQQTQAVVYDILPPTTATADYATSFVKLSANGLFLVVLKWQ